MKSLLAGIAILIFLFSGTSAAFLLIGGAAILMDICDTRSTKRESDNG